MNFTGKSKVSLIKSSTSMFHKKGDSTPPCGQPREIDLEKVESWTEITATLLERKLCTIFRREPGQERFARKAMIAGCHAESKALLMSRNAAAHTLRSTKADSIKKVREWAAESVDLPSRKPCWKSLIQFRERLYQMR
jgi:hypothetical protein